MLSDSIWYGRRKNLKEKGFEDCFFKKALLGAKVKLRGSGYGYRGQNRCPKHWEWVLSVDCVLLCVCWYLFLIVLQLVCNWVWISCYAVKGRGKCRQIMSHDFSSSLKAACNCPSTAPVIWCHSCRSCLKTVLFPLPQEHQ